MYLPGDGINSLRVSGGLLAEVKWQEGHTESGQATNDIGKEAIGDDLLIGLNQAAVEQQ